MRRDLATGRERTIVSGAGGAITPRPSPDGKWLAFVRRVDTGSRLFVRSLATGAERIPALLVGSEALVGLSVKTWNAALDSAGYGQAGAAARPKAAAPTRPSWPTAASSSTGALVKKLL